MTIDKSKLSTRKICFTLQREDFQQLRNYLPHGVQDKLFATIAVSLIPMLKTRQAQVLGGLLSGELIIDIRLKEESDETKW